MRVGSIDVRPVVDGRGREPLEDVVEHDNGAMWLCPDHPVDEHGRIALDLGGFLVRTASRTILVDAGVGSHRSDRRVGGQLLVNLARLGVQPVDVTDVVFTHLHFDHVGWATQQGQVVFPAATYRVHAADWAHFVTGPDVSPGAVAKLSPIADRLETFDSETELAPGLIARPAPGHTPGSTIFLIADAGERALLLGDVVHAVGELTDPHWHGLYDVDPPAARAVRDRIASEAAEAGTLIAAGHFPGLRFGRLVTSAGNRTFGFCTEDNR